MLQTDSGITCSVRSLFGSKLFALGPVMSSTTLVCLSIIFALIGLIEVIKAVDRRLEFDILANSVSQLSTQVDLLKQVVLSVEDPKRADTAGAEKLVPSAAEATSYLPWFAAATVLGLSLAWLISSLGVSVFSELTLASGSEVGTQGVAVAKAGTSCRILGRAQIRAGVIVNAK